MPSCKPASRKREAGLARLFTVGKTPLVMGVVNVTPDSFYAASRAASAQAAIARGLLLASQGAELLDVGGQSTRPGSEPISLEEELARVVPVIEALVEKTDLPISVDTDKAGVARAARAAGAEILNDVSALRNEPGLAKEAAAFNAVVLMHRGGASAKTMQEAPAYNNVVAEVGEFLRERLAAFEAAGGRRSRVLVDPGIGFGKTLEHNLSLLNNLSVFSKIAPVVLGASRKSFFGKISPDSGPEDRLAGSLAAAVWAAGAGVRVIRAHDVAETRSALGVWAAIQEAA